MRWFRRNSSDRNLEDGPQLLRLSTLGRRPTDSNESPSSTTTNASPSQIQSTRESSSSSSSSEFQRGRLAPNRNDGKYASMTNCYNIEQARITQCDRNEESKRSYLSKRRPISPSRIKLKYLAKQQQQQQQSQQQPGQESHHQNDSTSFRRQSSIPYDTNCSGNTSRLFLSSAKSMEWHVREDDHVSQERYYNNDAPNNNNQQKQQLFMGSISKAKSIDFLSSITNGGQIPEIKLTEISPQRDNEEGEFGEIGRISTINAAAAARGSSPMISNQKKFSGSSFTIFGDDLHDDGDSGILVNESGQCSILSDVQHSLKTVYLRKSNAPVGKSFGLLISQFARTFDTDQNRFRVRHILRNSEADLSGEVQVGDEIISVNDVPAIEMNFDEMQQIMDKKSVLRLVLQRGRGCREISSDRNGSTSTLTSKESIMRRYLTQQSIGGQCAPDSDNLCDLTPGKINKIHGGTSTIIKINCDKNNNTSNGPEERLSQNFCTIPRKRNGLSSLQQHHPYSFHTVVFEKGPGRKTLGFTIVGGNDSPRGALGIFVKRIMDNGQAADSQNLFEGDEILAVNGTVCHDLAHQEAVKMFKSIRQGKIVLNISRRVARIQM